MEPRHSPDDRFGKFIRTEKLGAGGMGEVWKAWDSELGRWVALKFLKGGDDAEISRFKHEAKIAGNLTHPNIAAIYEAGEARGRHFIAMQYIQGRTLKSHPRTNVKALVSMARDAAAAVAFAHEHGVIHRDLKPENIMVADSRVYVMDFGLARSVEGGGELSISGAIVGTPSYMSPEQARGAKVDERADVYSLGATLYALLTGHSPHRGKTLMELLRKVQDEDVMTPVGMDRDLRTIVMKCLDRDPDRRYSGAMELARDLDRWLKGEAIQAHGPSFSYRAVKWMGKRLMVLAISAIALAAVGITIGVLLPQWRAASARALAAEGEKREADRRREQMQKLSTLWAHALTIKEWTHQSFRKVDDLRAEFRSCERDVTNFIQGAPDLPQGYLIRAKVRICLEDYPGAEKDLLVATSTSPDFGPGWALLGAVRIELLWSDMLAASGENIDRLDLEALKSASDAFRRGDAGRKAAETWALSWSQEDETGQMITQALQEYYVEGKTDQARERLSRAAESAHSDEIYRWLGTWTHSVEMLGMAISISPFRANYYIHRSGLLRHLGRPKEAIADCTKAIEIDPGSVTAYTNRGGFLIDTGNLEQGLLDYERALSINPNFAIALLNRAYHRMLTNDLDGAVADCERILGLKGRGVVVVSKAYQYRGDVWNRRGDSARAIADFTKAIEIQPTNATAWIERSIERRPTDPHGALEDCEQALKIEPRSLSALTNRGDILYSLGDPEGAIRDFSEAILIDPTEPIVRLKRADVRSRTGDFAGAEEDVAEVLRTVPADWPHRGMAENLARRIREAKR